MFRRLRRAYHEWRIRLIEDDMRRTQDELNSAVAASDYDAINNSCYWLEILEADQRRHAYALSKIPQPT